MARSEAPMSTELSLRLSFDRRWFSAAFRRLWRYGRAASWPLSLSLLVLLTRIAPLSPIQDAVSQKDALHLSLSLPFWHLVFTPLCSVADALTVSGASQLKSVLLWSVCGILLLRSARKSMTGAVLLLVFLSWGLLASRPMGRLVSADPDVVLVDFHSHTEASHDGRRGFSAEENIRWHRAQGYDAAFITDHNDNQAAVRAKDLTEKNWRSTGYRSLAGEELSLFKTHLVVLGNGENIAREPFNSEPFLLKNAIQFAHARGLLILAALPEYWEYHSPPRDAPPERKWRLTRDVRRAETVDVRKLIAWGIDGFEIVNGDPKALDFPTDDRAQIVELCRRNNLLITGATDTHGYGGAAADWNAVRVPGWQRMGPAELERSILAVLHEKRFGAVTVVQRRRYVPVTRFQKIMAPVGLLIVYGRSLQRAQVIAWIGWIWGYRLALLCFVRLRRMEAKATRSFWGLSMPWAERDGRVTEPS